MRRSLRVACAALALLLPVTVVHGTRQQGERSYLAAQRYEDLYYVPPPSWLAVLSLGHREALADLLWLRSLIYFGDELMHRGQVKHLYQYTDAMLSLDPYFRRVYLWISSCALYRSGKVTVADAHKAIAYLERAVRLFPDDGELAWSLGATYSYELPPLLDDRAAKDEAKRQGLEHLKVAVLRGAGPSWLALSTAAELGRLGQREQEIAHVEEVFAQVSDPLLKEQLEMRLIRLRGAAYAEAMRQALNDIENARARDFPYVDLDLYLQVGTRSPFDGKAQLLRNFDPDVDLLGQSSLATIEAGAAP